MGSLLSGVSQGLTSSKERLHDGHVSQWGAAIGGGCGVGAMTAFMRFGSTFPNEMGTSNSKIVFLLNFDNYRVFIFKTPKAV